MKIIQKQESILHYDINLYYFEKNTDFDTSYTTQSIWHRAELDTFILKYGISYKAWSKLTHDNFISFESRLMLHCVIEDISIDNFGISKIKEDMHINSGKFLQQNSLSYFERLKFPIIDFSDTRALREKEAFIEMTKQQEPFEQKSKSQKDLETMLTKNLFTIK